MCTKIIAQDVLNLFLTQVHLFCFSSLSEILLYDLSSDGCLSPCRHGNLTLTRPSDSSEPWSCTIDSLDRLWLCQSVETEPLLCYQLTSDKVGTLMYQRPPTTVHSHHSCRWNSVLLKIIHCSLSFASGTISKVCMCRLLIYKSI